MADVTCPVCGATAQSTDLICPGCGCNLARPSRPPATGGYHGIMPAAQAGARPGQAATHCPHCGAEVPDPANLVCTECLRPLRAAPPDAARAPGTSGKAARATQTAAPGPPATERGLRLSFPTGDVDIPVGAPVLLGRDPSSPAAHILASHDNVSRRHATVGFTPAGQATVRDEHSTNGTYVNGSPVSPGEEFILADGAVLRLASDVTAHVHLPGPVLTRREYDSGPHGR